MKQFKRFFSITKAVLFPRKAKKPNLPNTPTNLAEAAIKSTFDETKYNKIYFEPKSSPANSLQRPFKLDLSGLNLPPSHHHQAKKDEFQNQSSIENKSQKKTKQVFNIQQQTTDKNVRDILNRDFNPGDETSFPDRTTSLDHDDASDKVKKLFSSSLSLSDKTNENNSLDKDWYSGKSFNVENNIEKDDEGNSLEFVPKWMKLMDEAKTKEEEDGVVDENILGDVVRKETFESADKLIGEVVEILEYERGFNITTLNVKEKTNFVQFIIIVEGRSKKQIYTLADAVKRHVRKYVTLGDFMMPENLSIEGSESDDWMLLDMGNVILHCFAGDARQKYDLEGLWNNMAEFVETLEGDIELPEDHTHMFPYVKEKKEVRDGKKSFNY